MENDALMLKQIVFCFFISSTVSGGVRPYSDISSLEGGLQTIIDGKVSAISRELILAERDITLPSIHPIEIHRFYIRPMEKWDVKDPFWRMNYFGYGERNGHSDYQNFQATDDTGCFLQSGCRTQELGQWVPITNDLTRGETNIGRGPPSGKTNLHNTRFKFVLGQGVTLRSGSGAEKHYTHDLAVKFLSTSENASFLALSEVRYINGFKTNITISTPTSFHLTTRAPNGAEISRLLYDGMHNDVFKKLAKPFYILYTEDGRHVRYDYELKKNNKQWYGQLKKVSGAGIPSVTYEYDKADIERLIRRTDSEGGFFQVDYYEPNETLKIEGYHFEKKEWVTHKIETAKDTWYGHAVKSIKAPSGEKGALVTTHRFLYPKKHRTDVYDQENHLTSYYTNVDYRPSKIIYWEDFKEDIVQETFWEGCLLKSRLIKDAKQRAHRKGKIYRYDTYGNVTEELIYGNLTGRGEEETYSKKYQYDSLHNLIREVHPNGMTIEYDYQEGTDRLIAKRIVGLSEISYRFDDAGALIEENETDRPTKRYKPKLSFPCFGFPQECVELTKKSTFEYHRSGQLTKRVVNEVVEEWTDFDAYDHPQTEITKTGSVIHRTYDSLGNVLEEVGPGEFKKSFKYDKMHRLTSKTETFKETTKTYTYTYDPLGRLTKYRDPYFQETRYKHDRYGRVIKTTYPDGSTESVDYDAFNNPIRKTDQLGHVTETHYTYYDKPSWIRYPDGSEERYLYDIAGNLIEYTSKSGATTSYEYDIYNRLIRKIDENVETTDYIGSLIDKITDASGTIRQFTYDDAGRKVSENFDGVTIQYAYDAMGRLYKTTHPEGSLVEIFDASDRVVASYLEDPDGTTHEEKYLEYDLFGNIKKETVCGISTYYEYDPWGRLLKKIDPLGYITTYIYEETTTLTKRQIDGATGYQTVEIYDPIGRLIEVEKLDFLGNTLQTVEILYDKAGNKLQEKHGDKVIRWEYNRMGKVIFEQESDRITVTHYNLLGEKDLVTKPDGTKISYDYYPNGRLKSLKCQGCHYLYTYDSKGFIQSITDPIHHLSVDRTYSPGGNLLRESYQGFTFTYTYDGLGRPTEILFPDDTSIEYTYNRSKMIRVKRGSFEHHYHFDPQGNISKESLFDGTTRCRTYDRLNRLTEQIHPHFSLLNLRYDSWGSLKERIINGKKESFEYDPLQQLTHEEGRTYSYDSHYNRLSPSIRNIKATYDGLDRLISVESNGETIHYGYDGLNRRLLKNKETYWYLDQNEVGSVQGGKVKEFRTLGLGLGAEIGAALSLELDGKTYLPHHDQAGHLIGIHRGDFKEEYGYSAFGENQPEGLSPWRFASKRLDPETGFIYFGRRYYDPENGRFTTPDPMGYADGINLYAYVHNRPLTHIDLYGLWDLLQGAYQILGALLGCALSGFQSITIPFDFSPSKSWINSHSDTIETNGNIPINHMVTSINGIRYSWADSQQHATLTSEIANGSKVYHVHNGTAGAFGDCMRYGMERYGNYYTHASEKLANHWLDYLIQHPSKFIVHYCHSEGALATKQAMKLLPKEMRDKIKVCAVAPACYLPKELAPNAIHIAGNHDFVHMADLGGYFVNQDRIIHANATGWFNHEYASYTDYMKIVYNEFTR